MVAGFKNTEMGVIPNDWDVSDITQIIDKTNGIKIGPFGSQLKKELLTNNGFKVYGQENVYVNNMEVGERYISKEHFQKLSSCEIKPKDFLISMMGTIGKCMIVPDKFESGIMDSHLIRLRLNEGRLNPELLLHFFTSNMLINQVKKLSVGGIMDGLSSKIVKQIQIPLPPTKAEQSAIVTALNDADALITQLEKLIAKKKAMKQGAVQELFKPQKDWKTKSLGDITNIRRGASPRPIKDPKWFSQKGRGWIRISDVTSSNVYLNSTTQYLSEEGVRYSVPVEKGDLIMSICATIGVPVIINIPACIHDGFVLFSNYENNLDTFYLFFFLQKETDVLVGKGQPGTQKNLNISIVGNIEISYPSVEEQKKIGLILKDIDIELSGLEQRLEKQKQLKQGMMQSLLTGKIRLNKQQESPQTIELKPEKSLNHNHYFEDAVLIAAIVNNFYSEKYVLGRKKVQKLLYLLRRKQEANTVAFKRKAAGPYADEVRYKGGEPIAKNKKYINISSSKLGTIFSKGEQIGEALGYIEKWGMKLDIEWLGSQFKFKTIDQLELLATIDMAMCDLEKENKAVSLENIKNLIKSDKEWKAKLEREIFSDSNIQLAIRHCFDLFEQQI